MRACLGTLALKAPDDARTSASFRLSADAAARASADAAAPAPADAGAGAA